MCAIYPAADRAAPDMVVKPVVPLLISCLDDLSIIENRELSSSTILYIFLSISLQFEYLLHVFRYSSVHECIFATTACMKAYQLLVIAHDLHLSCVRDIKHHLTDQSTVTSVFSCHLARSIFSYHSSSGEHLAMTSTW